MAFTKIFQIKSGRKNETKSSSQSKKPKDAKRKDSVVSKNFETTKHGANSKNQYGLHIISQTEDYADDTQETSFVDTPILDLSPGLGSLKLDFSESKEQKNDTYYRSRFDPKLPNNEFSELGSDKFGFPKMFGKPNNNTIYSFDAASSSTSHNNNANVKLAYKPSNVSQERIKKASKNPYKSTFDNSPVNKLNSASSQDSSTKAANSYYKQEESYAYRYENVDNLLDFAFEGKETQSQPANNSKTDFEDYFGYFETTNRFKGSLITENVDFSLQESKIESDNFDFGAQHTNSENTLNNNNKICTELERPTIKESKKQNKKSFISLFTPTFSGNNNERAKSKATKLKRNSKQGKVGSLEDMFYQDVGDQNTTTRDNVNIQSLYTDDYIEDESIPMDMRKSKRYEDELNRLAEAEEKRLEKEILRKKAVEEKEKAEKKKSKVYDRMKQRHMREFKVNNTGESYRPAYPAAANILDQNNLESEYLNGRISAMNQDRVSPSGQFGPNNIAYAYPSSVFDNQIYDSASLLKNNPAGVVTPVILDGQNDLGSSDDEMLQTVSSSTGPKDQPTRKTREETSEGSAISPSKKDNINYTLSKLTNTVVSNDDKLAVSEIVQKKTVRFRKTVSVVFESALTPLFDLNQSAETIDNKIKSTKISQDDLDLHMNGVADRTKAFYVRSRSNSMIELSNLTKSEKDTLLEKSDLLLKFSLKFKQYKKKQEVKVLTKKVKKQPKISKSNLKTSTLNAEILSKNVDKLLNSDDSSDTIPRSRLSSRNRKIKVSSEPLNSDYSDRNQNEPSFNQQTIPSTKYGKMPHNTQPMSATELNDQQYVVPNTQQFKSLQELPPHQYGGYPPYPNQAPPFIQQYQLNLPQNQMVAGLGTTPNPQVNSNYQYSSRPQVNSMNMVYSQAGRVSMVQPIPDNPNLVSSPFYAQNSNQYQFASYQKMQMQAQGGANPPRTQIFPESNMNGSNQQFQNPAGAIRSQKVNTGYYSMRPSHPNPQLLNNMGQQFGLMQQQQQQFMQYSQPQQNNYPQQFQNSYQQLHLTNNMNRSSVNAMAFDQNMAQGLNVPQSQGKHKSMGYPSIQGTPNVMPQQNYHSPYNMAMGSRSQLHMNDQLSNNYGNPNMNAGAPEMNSTIKNYNTNHMSNHFKALKQRPH